MPFVIGAILMTQIKAFKDSSKKSVEGVGKIAEEYHEKGELNLREKVEQAQVEFEKEKEHNKVHLENSEN